MNKTQQIIEQNFEQIAKLNTKTVVPELKEAVCEVIQGLDAGTLRTADYLNGDWVVNQWVKKGILLYFKLSSPYIMDAGFTQFYDKVDLKFAHYGERQWQEAGVRVVPHAIVRKGAFIGRNTVLMPSYVNIGAYIDEGAMIDTWATVGSCAQIGKNVHLSGGAGIGGVLEPLQANPTIIEDNCFIGARSEIVEGMVVERNSVISMGMFIGQSTKIFNRETKEVTYGRIPAGSVVVPGSLPSQDGSHSLSCAVIIKQIDDKTRQKVSINDLLRGR